MRHRPSGLLPLRGVALVQRSTTFPYMLGEWNTGYMKLDDARASDGVLCDAKDSLTSVPASQLSEGVCLVWLAFSQCVEEELHGRELNQPHLRCMRGAYFVLARTAVDSRGMLWMDCSLRQIGPFVVLWLSRLALRLPHGNGFHGEVLPGLSTLLLGVPMGIWCCFAASVRPLALMASGVQRVSAVECMGRQNVY